MRTARSIFIIFLLLGLFGWIAEGKVEATLGSCTASITPQTMTTSQTVDYTITLTNTGSSPILFFQVTMPSANFSIQGKDATGWSGTSNSSMAQFWGGSIAPSSSLNFILSIQSGTSEVAAQNLQVAANDVLSSDGTTGCTGSLGISISGVTDVTAPILSDTISVADVSAISAKISWTTDENTTSVLYYGTDENYGLSKNQSILTTAQSVTLDSLTANTTYHFYVVSTDASNNSAESSDGTFTTAQEGLTGQTVTVTNTVTNTVTSTKTETLTKTVILADTAKPTVSVTTKLAKAYAEAPIIEGKVVDTGAVNVGVAKIQYSTDNGVSWILVDEPSGASKVDFSFSPEVYEDGNYQIKVRATDQSGNIGVSSVQTLIIDRLPPRIIHSLWRVGPIVLSAPYTFVSKVPVQVTVHAVGGVTEMEIRIGTEKFGLIKNFETGLWEGDVASSLNGEFPIMVRAIDGGGNEIIEEIGKLKVGESKDSFLHPGASLTVYRLDELTKRYKPWNGEVYGQANPSNDKTSWYLPPGKYYVEAKGKGYQTAQSSIFNLDISGIVSVTGKLEKWSIWRFWESGDLAYILPELPLTQSKILGNQIIWLDRSSYRGKEIKLVVIPIWEPRIAGILAGLSEGDVVVIPGANKSSVDLLKSRGSYKVDILSDTDGEILSDLKGESLPAILNINRRGQVVQ